MKILSLLLMTLLLSGCVSQAYKNSEKTSGAVKDKIHKHIEKIQYSKAVSIELPPFEQGVIEEDIEHNWLKERVSLSTRPVLPLNLALEQLLSGTHGKEKIEIYFGQEVDPNIDVSLSLNDATLKQALNVLTAQTNYGFIYKDKSIEVERFVRKSFNIPIPPLKFGAQMGSQGKRASEGEGAIVEGQFINGTIEGENIVTKIIGNLEDILTVKTKDSEYIDGSVSAINGISMVTVKASAAKMREVERYIDDVKSELSKQVLLDFRIVEFRSSNRNTRGANLNLVRDIGEGTLKFFTQGTSLNPAATGYGFSFEGINGWEGTTAFLRALEQQGTVSTESPITMLALNNIPVQVKQNRKNPYLEDITSTVNEGVVTSSFTRGSVAEGIDFAALSSVQEEFVSINVSGKMNSVIKSELRKIGDNEVQFYTEREKDINYTGKMRYGRTYIISRVSQTKVSTEKIGNVGTNLIGENAANTEHFETLILLTPRRFEQ